jgi:ketosteroid isomerase-like protein
MADRDSLPDLYDAFNARDVDAVLAALAPDVHWPNGWEGGWVNGREEVRAYWRRQWEAIDSHAHPLSIEERPDGRVAVRVHQKVRDLQSGAVTENDAVHVYRFLDGLVVEMTIEEA